MKKILYILSFLLMAAWIAGTFVFGGGKHVHLLLIVAAISCMQALMICPRPQAERGTA